MSSIRKWLYSESKMLVKLSIAGEFSHTVHRVFRPFFVLSSRHVCHQNGPGHDWEVWNHSFSVHYLCLLSWVVPHCNKVSWPSFFFQWALAKFLRQNNQHINILVGEVPERGGMILNQSQLLCCNWSVISPVIRLNIDYSRIIDSFK